MAAEHADIVVVTNEDPYDDDPKTIIDDVAKGACEAGATGDRLRLVMDRREAVFAAMREAGPGDLVLLTGKGCEQAIMGPAGHRTPWDEREVAREAIRAAMR
jgi:UDP-N-acetylmuramoyl-L-alanyl-D-glutamate--2,6-diaminopimelate ligase